MLTQEEITNWDRMGAQVFDLEAERAKRRGAVPKYRSEIDAWFHMWTIPAQAYLYWLRELHRHARP